MVVLPGEPVWVGDTGVPVTVEGLDGEWRADPDALDQPFTGRTALLSPFDRLVHDRDRTRSLFDFEYVLEMYKPAAQRRWGYFALPVLHHDRLVGRLDAFSADGADLYYEVHGTGSPILGIHETPSSALLWVDARLERCTEINASLAKALPDAELVGVPGGHLSTRAARWCWSSSAGCSAHRVRTYLATINR
jgi:hypothetical protein